MELEAIGVKSLCLEGLVDYSIQAEDIIIYLCAFQGTFGCFFANIAFFFALHDVEWRPCISTLRPIDIMTQVCLWGYILRYPTYLGPGEYLLLGSAYRGRHVGDLGPSKIMSSLGDPAIPETGGGGRRPKDMLDTYDLIPILWHTPVQVGHVPHLPQP